MKVRTIGHCLSLCVAIVGPLAFRGSARAQADDTAQRPADLLVFGGYGYTRPDYDNGHNNGVTFGADYDRSFGWRLVPGLEARANINSGPATTQHSYLIGPRAHINLKRRYHPYADFMVGGGHITYPEYNTINHDGGLVFGFGGGVDIGVVHNLMFKADYQAQSWNMGVNSYTKPQGGDFTIGPTTVTVGVTYRIPFRKWVDSRHNYSR